MIIGDNPIKIPKDDVLGRTASAQKFAQHVLKIDTSEGAVVGVLGPWGSGKTSFINLARKEFEKTAVPILDFNPCIRMFLPDVFKRLYGAIDGLTSDSASASHRDPAYFKTQVNDLIGAAGDHNRVVENMIRLLT